MTSQQSPLLLLLLFSLVLMSFVNALRPSVASRLTLVRGRLPTSAMGSPGIRHLRSPPNRLYRLFGFGFGQKSEVDPGEVKGTNLRILKYPHPQLRANNAEIVEFDESLQQTAKEMLMVMYAAEGIGLAAPQVGINKRLMVFNEAGEPAKKEQEMVLVNPVIIARSEETNLKEEGCLSFPQINGDVQRHLWVEIEYQTVAGEKKKT